MWTQFRADDAVAFPVLLPMIRMAARAAPFADIHPSQRFQMREFDFDTQKDLFQGISNIVACILRHDEDPYCWLHLLPLRNMILTERRKSMPKASRPDAYKKDFAALPSDVSKILTRSRAPLQLQEKSFLDAVSFLVQKELILLDLVEDSGSLVTDLASYAPSASCTCNLIFTFPSHPFQHFFKHWFRSAPACPMALAIFGRPNKPVCLIPDSAPCPRTASSPYWSDTKIFSRSSNPSCATPSLPHSRSDLTSIVTTCSR